MLLPSFARLGRMKQHGNHLLQLLIENNSEQEVLERSNRLYLIRYKQHRKRYVKQFFYCCVRIIDEITFLPSRCIATIIRDKYRDPQKDRRDL
jgi:hypothetical protein